LLSLLATPKSLSVRPLSDGVFALFMEKKKLKFIYIAKKRLAFIYIGEALSKKKKESFEKKRNSAFSERSPSPCLGGGSRMVDNTSEIRTRGNSSKSYTQKKHTTECR
jgi:hypothetical protein